MDTVITEKERARSSVKTSGTQRVMSMAYKHRSLEEKEVASQQADY